MASEIRQYQALVNGAVSGFSQMKPKEREQYPAAATAQHYNEIRDAIAKLIPDVAAKLPPEVTFGKAPAMTGPTARFSDLSIYYGQLQALLSLYDGPRTGQIL